MQINKFPLASLALTFLLGSACIQPLSAQLDPAARLLLNQNPGAPRQAHGESLDAQVSVYVQCDAQATDWQAVRDLGAHVGICRGGLATITLPAQQLQALATIPGIRYVQAAQSAHLMLDEARADVGADLAHQYRPASASTEALPYTGHGVVIGQVDAGLDYMHRAFRTADGTLRISRVWEQATDAASASIPGLHAPEGYAYGAEFDTPELILRAGGDTDLRTHGTHVMGIAAGSDTWLDGQYQGIAPDAELVMVSIGNEAQTGMDNVQVSDAIQYIFDYADQVGKPCVINLSLGSHKGPHDGTSPFDQLADAMQGPGHLIVGASGNYGGDLFHVSRQVQATEAQPDTLQLFLCHAFYTGYAFGDVELWADTLLDLRFDLFDYNLFTGVADATESFNLTEVLDGEVREILLGRNITGSVQVTAEVNPLNGKQHLLLRSWITNQRNNHQVALRVVTTQGEGQLDLWADDAKITFATRDKYGVISLPEGFFNPDGQSTITEIGGTANRILSVGAYTTRDHFQLEGGDELFEVNYPVQTYPVNWTVPLYKDELCVFSGFGPTADGRQKPELCAPGSFIISAMSGHDQSSQYLASHYTDDDGHLNRYGYLQGTSMSCPVVTGAVALWLQACPTLTPEQLKEVVAASSRADDLTSDVRRWGAGRLDVLAGLKYCEQLNGDEAIHDVHRDAEHPASGTALFDLAGRRLSASGHQRPQPGLMIMSDEQGKRKVVFGF